MNSSSDGPSDVARNRRSRTDFGEGSGGPAPSGGAVRSRPCRNVSWRLEPPMPSYASIATMVSSKAATTSMAKTKLKRKRRLTRLIEDYDDDDDDDFDFMETQGGGGIVDSGGDGDSGGAPRGGERIGMMAGGGIGGNFGVGGCGDK